jgi:hypothetical protein
MDINPTLQLFWKDVLIGNISEPEWLDFPWAIGRFIPEQVDSEVHALLQWFHQENKKDDPDLLCAPFPDHFLENWTIVKSDGTRNEIGPPIPDFDDMTIQWR